MNRSSSNLAEKLQTLSPEEMAAVEDFVESLRVRRQDSACSRAMAKASASAFEAVWNNPEDDVYDAL